VPAGTGPASDQSARDTYQFQTGTTCPFCALTPQFSGGRSGLHWHDHWRSVGRREYVTLPLLAAALLGTQFIPTPEKANWNGPILFDDEVRDRARIRSANGRHEAAELSDVIFYVETLHPVVIDPLVVAWGVRQSPEVAWQMFVINAQAYALTLLLNDVTKRLTARARPWVGVDECAQNPASETCGSGGRYRAFYSGHAAVTATGAGLICAHHTQLSLYQNDWLDGGTCALAVLGTAVTGAMRVASDNHWASDVLVGHLLGYVSGYLLPTLLYYKEFRLAPHDHSPEAPTFAALPLVNKETLGMSLLGMF
jgi:membrane-associated phospholipid phosphatase